MEAPEAPNPIPRPSPTWRVALIAVCVIAAGFLVWQGLQPCDDAYITFRHAKNLAESGRPAWNLTGDPVLGSTTPALVFALGLGGMVAGADRIEDVALWLNAALVFLIVWLAFHVALDLARRPLPALLAAILVGFASSNVYVFSLGFENAMLTAAVLGCTLAVRRGHDATAVLLAGLAPLIRPEGLLLTPIAWGYVLLARRFRPKLIAAWAILPLVWLGFSSAYYGSPVPQPIHAKKKFPAIYRPYKQAEVNLADRIPTAPQAALRLWTGQAEPLIFSGTFGSTTVTHVSRAASLAGLLALGILALVSIVRRNGRLVHLVYPPAFLLLYGWIGRTEVWYFPSFTTTATIALFAAIAWLIATATKRAPAWVPAVLSIAVFAAFIHGNAYRIADAKSTRAALHPTDPRGIKWERWEAERFDGYKQAAEKLNPQSTPADVALTSEVGVFGYFYRGAVLDAVGICSPEALAFYPPPPEDIADENGRYRNPANNLTPTPMVMTLRPRFVVNSLVYLANLNRKGNPVLATYRPIGRVGRAWGKPIQLLERVPDDGSDDIGY